MKLFVYLGILEGADPAQLDDVQTLRTLLEKAVSQGNFSLHDLRVVHFEPQGVTAAAIVGESHLTLHTWPEEGRVFVDIASCGDEGGVQRAFDTIVEGLPGARVVELSKHQMGR